MITLDVWTWPEWVWDASAIGLIAAGVLVGLLGRRLIALWAFLFTAITVMWAIRANFHHLPISAEENPILTIATLGGGGFFGGAIGLAFFWMYGVIMLAGLAAMIAWAIGMETGHPLTWAWLSGIAGGAAVVAMVTYRHATIFATSVLGGLMVAMGVGHFAEVASLAMLVDAPHAAALMIRLDPALVGGVAGGCAVFGLIIQCTLTGRRRQPHASPQPHPPTEPQPQPAAPPTAASGTVHHQHASKHPPNADHAAPPPDRSRRAPVIATAVLVVLVAAGAGLWWAYENVAWRDWVAPNSTAITDADDGSTVLASSGVIGPLTVEPIDDLAALPPLPDGKPLLAASRYGPEGATFKKGLETTWTLPEPLEPGQKLWIVTLNEKHNVWLGTGETAIVDESGTKATGRLYHFSVNGLRESIPTHMESGLRFLAHERGESGQENRIFSSIRTEKWNPTLVDEGKRDRMLRWYAEKFDNDRSRPLTVEDFSYMMSEADYATVKKLIEDGAISNNHSMEMSQIRSGLVCRELKQIAQEDNVRIYRSDSGNFASGFRSDLDQTIAVYEPDGRGGWQHAPDRERAVIQKLNGQLKSKYGLTPEKLNMDSFPTSNKVLDFRLVANQVDAQVPAARRGQSRHVQVAMNVAETKRQPGAIWTTGGQVQQAHERAYLGLKNPQPRPFPTPPPAGIAGDLPQPHELACTVFTPDEDGVEMRGAAVDEAVKVMFDGLPPEVNRAHAYDAVANNIFDYLRDNGDPLQPNLNKAPPVKNLLRSIDNGLATKRQFDIGLKRFDYETLADKSWRRVYVDALCDFEKLPKGKRDRWFQTLETARDLRLMHKQGPISEVEVGVAFRPLAEELAREAGSARWEEFLPAARYKFHQAAMEIMTYSLLETAEDRVLGWLATENEGGEKKADDVARHLDEDLVRRSLGLAGEQHDAAWKRIRDEVFRNYADTARVQLLYTLHEMSPEMRQRVVAKVTSNMKLDESFKNKFRALAEDAGSRYFHARRFQEMPRLYREVGSAMVREFGSRSVPYYTRRVRDHFLADIGVLPDPANKQKVIVPLGKFKNVNIALDNMRIVGPVGRYVRNAVLSLGNLDVAAQVFKAYSVSGGDPEVMEQVFWEVTINALPGVAQVKGILAADTWTELGANATMIGVLIAVPGVGQTIFVCSLVETGYVLYQHEYSIPLTNMIADGIYRGYVGPSLYDFAKDKPPQFTDGDRQRLDDLNARYETLPPANPNPETIPWMIEREKLRRKKLAWKAYVAEQARNEGGALFGLNAQLKQKMLKLPGNPDFKDDHPLYMDGPILARVKPYILYARSNQGPVDFTIKPLSATERKMLEDLKGSIDDLGPIEQIDAAYTIAELEDRHQAYERAQRYLKRARELPELMHQIRVDSLSPYIDHDPSQEMVNVRRYVDLWFAERMEMLIKSMAEAGATVDKPKLRKAREQIFQKMIEDIRRSQRLWNNYQHFQKITAERREQQRENAMKSLYAAMMNVAAIQPPMRMSEQTIATLVAAGNARESLRHPWALSQAIFWRSVPHTPPEISIDLRMVEVEPDKDDPQPGDEDYTGPTYEWRPDIKVVADPAIYPPPYAYSLHQLDAAAARAAIAAGTHDGLKLTDTQIDGLREYLKVHGDRDPNAERITPAALVFVYSKGFVMPDRVEKITLAGMPRPDLVTLPGGGSQAYLLGGSTQFPEDPPAPEVGDIRLATELWMEASNEDRPPKPQGTRFTIESKALKQITDSASDTMLVFDLHYAESRNGPFERAGTLWDITHPDSTFTSQNEADLEAMETGRLTLERSTLNFATQDGEFTDLTAKPYYFKVSQYFTKTTAITDEDVTPPEEEFSNVAGPGEPTLIFPDRRGLRDQSTYETGILAGVTRIDLPRPDVHFTARYLRTDHIHYTLQSDGWTGHFWSRNPSAWFNYESDRLRVPGKPRSLSVNITAEVHGQTGEKSLSIIPAEPDRLADGVERKIDDAKKALARAEQRRELAIKNLTSSIQRYQDQLANATDSKRAKGLQLQIQKAQASLAKENSFQKQYNQTLYEISLARANGDWKAALSGQQKLVGLAESGFQQDKVIWQLTEAYNDWEYLESGRFAANMQQRYQQNKAKYAGTKTAREQIKRLERIIAPLAGVGRLAERAGDLQAYQQSRLRNVELLEQIYQLRSQINPDAPQSSADSLRSSALRDIANVTARLTGDQHAAMKQFIEGVMHPGFLSGWRDDRPKPTGLAERLYHLGRLPAWWPHDADGKPIIPGDPELKTQQQRRAERQANP